MKLRTIGVWGSLLLAFTGSAAAGPAATEAPSPCVNREKIAWRQVRDAAADDKELRYCTGEDCWSLNLTSNAVTSIAKLPVSKKKLGQSGAMVDDNGAVVATATQSGVEFCPTGPASCKKFSYKIANPPVNGVFPIMNDERTLGAVMYRGESEAGAPSFVLMYDLVRGALIKQLKANDVEIVGHGFLIDDVLYTASLKKLGKLATPDQGWSRIGKTDLLALHDKQHGAIVLQDTSTGKVKARIALDAKDPDEFFVLSVSPDASRLYAIGSHFDEGVVVAIDVAAGKVVSRSTPPECAPGTHRVN